MARCILAQGGPPERTPENYSSASLMRESIRLSIQELQSSIDEAQRAIAKFKYFSSTLDSLVENGQHLSPDDLKALEGLTDDWIGELGFKEWPIFHVNSCCMFLLGEEMRMENGDVYRDRVLVETVEQRRAAAHDAKAAARLAALERQIHEIEWNADPQSEQEAADRAELLDAIERKAATEWIFPGEVFAAFGIGSRDGHPLVSTGETEHLASDARDVFARVITAMEK